MDTLQRRIDAQQSAIAALTEQNAQLRTALAAALQARDDLDLRISKILRMEAIGVLVGGIAHDFNNILASLIGFTELALDEAAEGSRQADNLREAYRAGSRAKALVKQLLTLTHQTAGSRKPIRMDILVKALFKFVQSAVPAHISIVKQIRSDKLVVGDPVDLYQALLILVTHAAQAMEPNGGVLNVRLHDVVLETANHAGLPAGMHIEIIITDTGPGLPAERLESIFKTQRTADRPTGPPLAYDMVKKLGGEIVVQSREGYGTVSRVFLPAVADQAQTDRQSGTPPGGSERVLFVDSDPAIARMVLRSLQSLGYRVTTLNSGVQALKLLARKRNHFDLVIADLTMPRLTGNRLARQIRLLQPGMPIILMSGDPRRLPGSAAAADMLTFLAKPVSSRTLAETVRRVLDTAPR